MFSSYKGLPRTAWIIFGGTIVNRLGFMVVPFLVYYLGSRDVSTSQVTYVLGCLGIGTLVGPLLSGVLADRWSRRQTMITGLVGTAVSHGLLFVAPNLVSLALAAAVLSVCGTMVSPSANAILGASVDAERRRNAFSLVYWAVNIGSAGAGILGGFLAEQGYWLLFLVDGSCSIAYAFIVASLLPADRQGSIPLAGRPTRGYGVVFRDPLMRGLLPLFGITLAIYSLTEAALPLSIRDDGLSPKILGLMATVNAVVVVVLQPIATTVLDRFRPLAVYVCAAGLIGLGVALTGLAHDVWTYAATVVVWSVGEAAIGGIHSATIQSIAPEHARGRYQGAFQWLWGSSRFVALTAGTALYASAGPAFLWWFCALAGVFAPLGVLALAPAIDRRAAELEKEKKQEEETPETPETPEAPAVAAE
ncbi:putative MFS family arabinose efflux permease [Streptomyces sp. KhCrAH-43]|uniref:MFS transporter n=1 Tax=unclassified Streptomyces TaxID=2593676 RepID=UPI00037245BE|nr:MULTISPECIES: MFS transporter [unclassified Streptomyces]MYS38392.1 MFS transporter [Streptomyces sp. SID4920]MYX66584.1 MFS transporter [Streptomyces sp. SID8373]RAJ68077.1 putative MFS family arabinose efflux permease [Streptomyces sp. KhCrAH-43]